MDGNVPKILSDLTGFFGLIETKFFEKRLDKILTMWFTYSVAGRYGAVRHESLKK